MPDPNNLTFIKDRVSFMCLPKCANTSFKMAICNAWLLPFGPPPKINHWLAQINENTEPVSRQNKYWIAAQDNHLALTIVRHPQARIASWIRDKGLRGEHSSARKLAVGPHSNIPDIVHKISETDDSCDQHYRSMCQELVVDDQLVPHFVAKIEHINEDWTIIRELVLEQCIRDLGPRLPYLNGTRSLNKGIYFTAEDTRKLANRYAKDFEMFDYEPEPGTW